MTTPAECEQCRICGSCDAGLPMTCTCGPCTCQERCGHPDCGSRPAEQYEPCPPEPCQYCTGNSAVRDADGRLLTSWEWCQQVNACAATIDWDQVYGHG